MYKITIPGELPTLNDIIEAAKLGRGRYQPYNIMKQEHTNHIAWICKSKIKEKLDRIDVNIKWISPNRRKDKDNIMAGTKFILDGLVRGGTIANDGWKQIGAINHDWGIDKDNPRIEVTVKEV